MHSVVSEGKIIDVLFVKAKRTEGVLSVFGKKTPCELLDLQGGFWVYTEGGY